MFRYFESIPSFWPQWLGYGLTAYGLVIAALLACALMAARSNTLVRKSIAWWLRKIPFEKETMARAYVHEFASWLDPQVKWQAKCPPFPDRTHAINQLKLSRNRCYETWYSPTAQTITKTAVTKKGNHLLSIEARSLRRLAELEKYADNSLPFPFPRLLRSERRHGYRTNIMSGFCPGEVTAAQLLSDRGSGMEAIQLGWIFHRLLHALTHVHDAGLVHAAILPQHLVLDLSNRSLTLVDWTHAKRFGEPFCFIPRRYAHFYPIEAIQREFVSAESDIYMAAKCLIALAGGNPHTNTIPSHLPRRMAGFLRACLLQSPRMRPGNTTELFQEFGHLMEDVPSLLTYPSCFE